MIVKIMRRLVTAKKVRPVSAPIKVKRGAHFIYLFDLCSSLI